MRNFRKHFSDCDGDSFLFSSCSKDDAPMVTIVNSQVYDLGAVGNSGISGTAKFIETVMQL
jgi:hypothetical protein